MELLQTRILGLTLEDKGDGLSDLTIDLVTAVPADELASLLQSLATLYSIGYSVESNRESGWIHFGKAVFLEPSRLYITQLEIGTPNKVKVTGLSSVLNDIHKILEILTLATALLFPSTASQQQTINQTTIVETGQPRASESTPAYSPLEFQQAINANIQMRMNLDEALADGRMSLQDYLERRGMLDQAHRVLLDSVKVTRMHPET